MLESLSMQNFSSSVIQWFYQHGRKHLPWQQSPTPYHVWVSEIMLQQTQVATVMGYYERFIKRFPDVFALSNATQDEVLEYWAGLGYYARGRNLHKAAQMVGEQFNGRFPDTVEGLVALPGIGRSTAGAIVSLGYHKPAVILDGNVKRVLARVHAIPTWPDERQTLKSLWVLAESLTPKKEIQAYNQAMMDLGAMVCTRSKPNCMQCPLTSYCKAYQQNQTDKFPVSKPKKSVPERSGEMFIVQREDEAILLFQRESPGIWGGLWCLPEKSHLPDGLIVQESEPYGRSTHTFTHYRWHVDVTVLRVEDLVLNHPGYLWYTGEAQAIGLAAIVKKLLPTLSAA